MKWNHLIFLTTWSFVLHADTLNMEDPMTTSPGKPDPIHTDSTEGPFVYLGEDGTLMYTPYTDLGDRIIDFSYAGYRASEKPIPFVRVVETLTPLEGEAAQEGTMAYAMGPCSRDEIQSAIDRVAAMEPDEQGFKGTVFLSKGTYYLQGGLTVRSGVVLRGEGERGFGTVLYVHNPGEAAITMGNPEGRVEDMGPVVRIADEVVPSGAMRLTVENAGAFHVGDEVHIRKTVNQEWIDLLGMDNPGSRPDGGKVTPWTPEAYRIKHIREITGIDGNTLTLDAPLPQSFVKAHGGGEVNQITFTGYESYMGVEGMRIIGNYDTAVTSEMRAPDGPYAADEEQSLSVGVRVLKSAHAWVRGVTVEHTRKSAVSVQDSRYVTVMECSSLKPVSVIRGGRRYSFNNSDSSMVLFIRCFAEEGRHDFVTGSRDSGPIAFVRGTTERALGPTETHQRWASGVLFDNITMKDGGGIQVINRGAAGTGHGWSGANGVIWNSTAPYIRVQNPPTPEQNFAIGCTATAAEDARWKGVTGNGHIDSVGTRVLPESLFEAQLAERIGEREAYRVLAMTLSKASLNTQVIFPRPVVDGVIQGQPTEEQVAFEEADQREWEVAMSDDGTGDWTEQWFLDGEGQSTVTNSPEGMELKASDGHMVLWTNDSFAGDVKIEYEFTRTDPYQGGVCILYIQGSGRGDDGYEKDITQWNEYREDANMGFYFRNMDLYHVSYACGYVRGRRYRPDIRKMNTFSELDPEYLFDHTELFELGATYKITVIKTDRAIRMKAVSEDKGVYFMLDNVRWDPVTEGRIGLRQMKGRWSRYKNFRVSVPKE
jgi:hypothetical protein